MGIAIIYEFFWILRLICAKKEPIYRGMEHSHSSDSALYPYPLEEIQSMADECGFSVEQMVKALHLKETAKSQQLSDSELADALIWSVWVDINPKKCPLSFALLEEAITRLQRR